MKKYRFVPEGVCSREIIIEVDNNVIKSCEFVGGCSGNAIGICELVKGKKISDVIEKLRGIPCGSKMTSCPDQLSKALKQIKDYEKG